MKFSFLVILLWAGQSLAVEWNDLSVLQLNKAGIPMSVEKIDEYGRTFVRGNNWDRSRQFNRGALQGNVGFKVASSVI